MLMGLNVNQYVALIMMVLINMFSINQFTYYVGVESGVPSYDAL